jgi:hypothetical protein
MAETDFLVLWKWEEALRWHEKALPDGNVVRARGKYAGGLNRGDRVFYWATKGNELYLLGAIEVKRSWRKPKSGCEGRSLYGPFQIIPLKEQKWKIRFQSAVERLGKPPFAGRVRGRRRLTPQATRLLKQILSKQLKHIETIRMREGKRKTMTLSKRERNRDVRVRALARNGYCCKICCFDFAKRYGEFAKDCVEVHHLTLLSSAGKRGRTTTLDDVLVVCPNCHRALHRFGNPTNWKAFQRTCHLACAQSSS